MTEYSEVQGDDDSAEAGILSVLAGHMPYAFIVAKEINPDITLQVSSTLPDEDTLRGLLTKTLRALPAGMKNVSDGYHTFEDLYAHRRALTAVLAASAASAGDSWRSKRHHPEDSPMFDGSFIVGINLPLQGMITYHYNLEHWDDFAAVPELEHAPKWDGAGPDETVSRLLAVAHLVGDMQEAGK
jgi:hypothetical protein